MSTFSTWRGPLGGEGGFQGQKGDEAVLSRSKCQKKIGKGYQAHDLHQEGGLRKREACNGSVCAAGIRKNNLGGDFSG